MAWKVGFAILWATAAFSADPESRPPIIDVHMHARTEVMRTPEGVPASSPCNPDPCEGRTTAVQKGEDILRLTQAAMERWNIVAAVVTDKEFENVDQWIAAAPDRFIPGAGILDPTTVAVEDMRKDFLGGRFRVMGEIAAQYTGYGADDHRVKPYFDLAAELDVPVLVHSAGLAGPSKRFRLALGSPLRLEDTLVRHPGLRVYFENAGWPYLEDMLALMYRYPNVYADVSTITWIIPRRAFHAYLRGLIEGGVAKRIMFGSDQMHWPEVIDEAVEAIESADFLTEQQKRDIFYNNASRFLRFGRDKAEEDHGSKR